MGQAVFVRGKQEAASAGLRTFVNYMRYFDSLTDTGPRVSLTRQDLIAHEGWLKNVIQSFLPFKSYSLFFPEAIPSDMLPDGPGRPYTPVYIAKERKVLLPLVLRGEFMAVFMAREAKVRYAATSLPYLGRMAEFCLEELLLHKIAGSDPQSGLPNLLQFQRRLAVAIKAVRSAAGVGQGDGADAASGQMASFGVIRICPGSYQAMCNRFGLNFSEMVVGETAALVGDSFPQPVMAFRLDEDSFALLLPEASVPACRRTAESAHVRLSELRFAHDLTGEVMKLTPAVGFACYPQDMAGRDFDRSPEEQAVLLQSRLLRAVDISKAHGRVFGFSQILEEGGRIVRALESNRFLLDLGRSVGALEGQRFLALAQDMFGQSRIKGEVMLTAVREDESLAELLELTDSSDPIAGGEELRHLGWRSDQSHEDSSHTGDDSPDPRTGLYPYKAFLGRLSALARTSEAHVLALVRLASQAGQVGDAPVDEERVRAGGYDHEAALLATETKTWFGQDLLAGRHSQTGVFFFHPNLPPDQLLAGYRELKDRLRRDHGLEIVVALAAYPYLDYRKTDLLDNVLKTLDYAMLLPEPRVGLFGTLALNINADRLFSQGDLYGAVEEYKSALLADETNLMARNSLAICLARLNRLPQARQEFEEVIKRSPKDVMATYNLGCICRKLGEVGLARKYFNKTLKLSPSHVYSLIRLGQLAEHGGRYAQAKKYYLQAASTEEGQILTNRALAELALRRGAYDEAREYLHQALAQNSNDAGAMHLLARLYLDLGEDPEIAEVLARQSVALHPNRKLYWLELIRALESRGKIEEVKTAKLRLADLP